jgi:hypothetical protein
MNSITEAGVTIATAIVGLAIVAVLVSKNAQTASDIQAAASGFGNSIGEAISPVTGNGATPNLSYPSHSFS